MDEELIDNNGIDRDLAGTHISHLPPLESLKQMTKEEKQEWVEKLKCISMTRMYKGIVLPCNELEQRCVNATDNLSDVVLTKDMTREERKDTFMKAIGTTKKLRPV